MRNKMQAIVTVFAALALAACTLPVNGGEKPVGAAECSPGSEQETSEAGLKQISLCVTSEGKAHNFTVEVAESPQQQARGLMFRTELADDAGMLFPYQEPRPLSFWMKNTVIPLDIIFVNPDGRIGNIAANTIPYSLEPIASDSPGIAVLELRGGLAAELGIEAGDKIDWKK